jgi:type IV secretion system protein VirD4
VKKLPFKSATYNALDGIGKDDLALDGCNAIGKEVVVRNPGDEKDGHWLDSAEKFISTITATVVQYGTPPKRSLQEVADILASPQKLDLAIQLALQSQAWDGLLARRAAELTHFVEKEKSSVLTTCGRFLGWLSTPAMLAATRASSFTPRFKARRQTVYIVLPPEFMKSGQGWLRLMLGSMIRAVVREGRTEYPNVHFVLDESSSLGVMENIESLVEQFRKYGCRNQFYYQSAGALAKCWPRDQGQTLMSSAAKIFFGVADIQTAQLVSKMLGNETILVEDWSTGTSGGDNRGWSESTRDVSRSGGSNKGWSKTDSLKQAPRELLKPEEILNSLPPRTAITFPGGGMPPVCTNLVRYFEEPGLFRPNKGKGVIARMWDAVRTLFSSALILVTGIILAALMTQAVNMQANAPRQPMQPQLQPQWKPQPEPAIEHWRKR